MNVRCRLGTLSRGCALALLLAACGGSGGDGANATPLVVRSLAPGTGIQVFQVSFDYPNAPHPDTAWGRLLIDPQQIYKDTGLRGGLINVATGQAWAVTNVPLLDPAEGPYAVYFDLGLAAPMPIQSIPLHVKHSNRAVGAIADHLVDASLWSVTSWVESASGIDAAIDPGPPPHALALASRLSDLLFPVETRTQAVTNVQCAHNQCMTMATANAMAYLEDMGVWALPSAHTLGLGGDLTLVGRLDTACGRTFASRQSGNGLWFVPLLDGTFGYLADEGLDGLLDWSHQGHGYGGVGEAVPAGDYTAAGSTSVDEGVVIRYGWIRDRVAAGCGVIAAFRYDAGGGHAVRVTGIGRNDDRSLWLRYSHDGAQSNSDPTDTHGLENVVIDLEDSDGDGRYNFGSPSRELVFVWAACP